MILFSVIFLYWPEESINEKNGNGTGNGNETSEFDKKINEINIKTLDWLDTLDVNPIELRYEMGIKGKKKFVELLDSYLVLFETAENETDKSSYKSKVEQLAQFTKDEKYHDMNDINDTQFRQDSTSYLRAWYILDKFGLDTSYYKQQIDEVLPRLDSHLPGRGINQKMAFVLYYTELGYSIDYTLEELFEYTVIRSGKNKTELDWLEVYFITHEIFALYDDNQMDILTSNDLAYIKDVVPYYVNDTITENDVDLLAELIMIMTYLGFEDEDYYETALEYLLESQNLDGSFGDYEYAREHYEDLGISVEIYLYLHTTEVSLRALNEAVDVFSDEWIDCWGVIEIDWC